MTPEELNKLWLDFSKTKDKDIKDKLIIHYAYLVNVVASRLNTYLDCLVELDELKSMGIFGLIDAIDKFDVDKNIKFETYATIRIRGEILDQIRKNDWMPKDLRYKQKLYFNKQDELTLKLNRKPTDSEMMQELGLSDKKYYSLQNLITGHKLVNIDDTDDDNLSAVDKIEQSAFDNPEDKLLKDELKDKISDALKNLTEQESLVIKLYYYNDLTFSEISNVLGVSDSRISQVHSKALKKLSVTMGKYMNLIYKNL